MLFHLGGIWSGFAWGSEISQGVKEIKLKKMGISEQEADKSYPAWRYYYPTGIYDGKFSSPNVVSDAYRVNKFFGENGLIFASLFTGSTTSYTYNAYITNLPSELEGKIKGVLTGISDRLEVGYKNMKNNQKTKAWKFLLSTILCTASIVLSIVCAPISIASFSTIAGITGGVVSIIANIAVNIIDAKTQTKLIEATTLEIKAQAQANKNENEQNRQIINSLVSAPQEIFPQGAKYEAQRVGAQDWSPSIAYDPNKGILGTYHTNMVDEIIFNRAQVTLAGNSSYASNVLGLKLAKFEINKRLLNGAMKNNYDLHTEFLNNLITLLMDTYAKYDTELQTQFSYWQDIIYSMPESVLTSQESQYENNYQDGLRYSNAGVLATALRNGDVSSDPISSREDIVLADKYRQLALSSWSSAWKTNFYKIKFLEAWRDLVEESADSKIEYSFMTNDGPSSGAPRDKVEQAVVYSSSILKEKISGMDGFKISCYVGEVSISSYKLTNYLSEDLKDYISLNLTYCLFNNQEYIPLSPSEDGIKTLLEVDLSEFKPTAPIFCLPDIYATFLEDAKGVLEILLQAFKDPQDLEDFALKQGFILDSSDLIKAEFIRWLKNQELVYGDENSPMLSVNGENIGELVDVSQAKLALDNLINYEQRDKGFSSRSIENETYQSAYSGISHYELYPDGTIEENSHYDTSEYKSYT